ncbi:MAG: hypothetical protein RPU13_13820 [Candidatus Sedimenticola sp. (ex Thyasira tokunagai)]
MASVVAGAIIKAVAAKGFMAMFITAAVNFAVSYVVSAILKPSKPSSGFTSEATDRTVIVRSPISPHRAIYGRGQFSGTLAFAEVTGTTTKYLHLVILLAGREVNDIGTVYFNDIPETDERWDGYIRINRHLGSPDQLADADLVAESSLWTTAHRIRGRAYIYVRLKQSRDAFPTGIPNIKAYVEGHKVLDIRADEIIYSENPALCMLDYIRWSQGVGAQASEVDESSWIAAANACDEAVTIDVQNNTQPRYTCNGSFTLDRSPIDVLGDLKSSMAGAVIWSMGTWEGHAGVATAASGDIGEDDLRGSIKYRNKPGLDQRFNAVRGVYTNPDDHWQPTDLKPVTNAYYEGQDREQIFQDVELSFCVDHLEAQRNAKIELEDHRQSLMATLPLMLGAGLKLRPYQVIRVTIGPLGWANKLFRIIDWQLVEADGGLGVDIVIKEYADEVYDWNYGEATTRDLAPNTNLPDPSDIGAPTAIQLASGTDELLVAGDGTVVSRLRVDWTPPADSAVERVDIQYKRTADVDWISIAPARSGETTAWISPVQDGEHYDVRLRSVNIWGVHSTWETAYNHPVAGKSAPPADVAIFNVDRQPDGTRQFTWSTVSDPDLAGYRIKTRLGTGWSWNDLEALHEGLLTATPWETNQLAAGHYTAGIVAVDSTGNESQVPTLIQSSLGDPRINNSLAYEAPHLQGWPGTKTNCLPDNTGGALTALGDYSWDDLTTWDDWTSWAENPFSQISYEHPQIDLGTVLPFVPLISVDATGNPTTEINLSDDGVTWSGWQVPDPQVTARYIKARVTVAQVATEIPRAHSMGINLSGETISETVNDADTSTWGGSAAAGRVIPISKAYAAVTKIGISMQSVGPGWSWDIVDKTDPANPTIRIYNNGTPADCIIDAAVTGIPTQ